tara:strand:- start:13 stop:951 length:939 start_codon:yes stop_codon:yes gene_type:complete
MKNGLIKRLFKTIILFFLIFVPTNAIEISIVTKVHNEIITNIDIENEYKYLIALNNELKNLKKKSILDLAKDSIIREKIKKNELIKYYTLDHTKDYLNDIMKNFYAQLNLQNIDEFENYLKQYDLRLNDVKKRIEIEVLWNQLIASKFEDQININKKVLEKKVNDRISKNEMLSEYDISEIVFQVDGNNNLKEKMNAISESIKVQGFKNTANIYSVAATSKFGGNLGWIKEGQLTDELNKLLKTMVIGEISQPMKIPNGYMILQMQNKREVREEVDREKLLKDLIRFEKDKQYNRYSIMYYNKIKLNTYISE